MNATEVRNVVKNWLADRKQTLIWACLNTMTGKAYGVLQGDTTQRHVANRRSASK